MYYSSWSSHKILLTHLLCDFVEFHGVVNLSCGTRHLESQQGIRPGHTPYGVIKYKVTAIILLLLALRCSVSTEQSVSHTLVRKHIGGRSGFGIK